MDTNSSYHKFLEAIICWNNRRRNLRDIPATDVYLNLIYDLGGRIPKCEEDNYTTNNITVEQRKCVLANRLLEQLEYLINDIGINEELIVDFLMLSMNKFLDNMLERILIQKISSRSCYYICYTNLISNDVQEKLAESKQLWHQIINRKMPIQDKSLALFTNSNIYNYDSIDTTYSYLKSIDSLSYPFHT